MQRCWKKRKQLQDEETKRLLGVLYLSYKVRKVDQTQHVMLWSASGAARRRREATQGAARRSKAAQGSGTSNETVGQRERLAPDAR